MFSTILHGVNSTSVLLCAWDFCSCWFLFLSSGVVNRTLSHICGRLYLPMFLLVLGLLILMYMDLFCFIHNFTEPMLTFTALMFSKHLKQFFMINHFQQFLILNNKVMYRHKKICLIHNQKIKDKMKQ